MRRVLLALCIVAGSLGAQKTRASIGLPGYSDKFPIEDVTNAFTLDAPVDKSFAAVRAAFADLKVVIDQADSSTGIIGKHQTPASLSYAGYRMSRIFDCGQGATTGPNADTYRLTIVFLVLLDPIDASHTKLQIGFVAGGEPPGSGRSAAVQCGSKGVMESRLVELANQHLK